MTLAAAEFIRRFLLHVLPTGFHRIRYYGFLGARHRRAKLARCRQLLGATAPLTTPANATSPTDYRDRMKALTGISLRVCPACHQGEMIVSEHLVPVARRGVQHHMFHRARRILSKYRKVNTRIPYEVHSSPHDLSGYDEPLFPVVDTPIGRIGCAICCDWCAFRPS